MAGRDDAHDPITALRADFAGVWDEVRTIGKGQARLEGRFDTLEKSVVSHTRPCPDFQQLKKKVDDAFERAEQEKIADLKAEAKERRASPKESETEVSFLRSSFTLVLKHVVVPLTAAVAAILGYIFHTGAK